MSDQFRLFTGRMSLHWPRARGIDKTLFLKEHQLPRSARRQLGILVLTADGGISERSPVAPPNKDSCFPSTSRGAGQTTVNYGFAARQPNNGGSKIFNHHYSNPLAKLDRVGQPPAITPSNR